MAPNGMQPLLSDVDRLVEEGAEIPYELRDTKGEHVFCS